MAHKKGQGSCRNGRDSVSKRLGVKELWLKHPELHDIDWDVIILDEFQEILNLSEEPERLAVIAHELRTARVNAVRLRSVFDSMLDGVPSAVNICLLVGGAYRIRSGQMTVGELSSFIYLFTLLVFPLRLIGFALSELPHSWSGWQRIRVLLDQPVLPDPSLRLRRGADNGVLLSDLHFVHADGREVLAGVDAQIPAGRTVAVVGATGSGKTTLLHLIAGLVEPTSGSVEVPAEGAAIVLQEAFLLAGSVRENICLGLPFADDAIDAALAAAEAGFVHELVHGLNTEIGERGAQHEWGYGCGECPACRLRAGGYVRYRETAA